MPITSLTNTNSLDAQRQVQKQQQKATDAMSRLASGSQLNQAKDNPSARTVATNLRTNIAAATAVIGNMNDGQSMVDVVANSLTQIQDKLIRLKQLATQASSTILAPKQQNQINIEFQKGLQFINDTANSTIYNGQNLLIGGASTVTAAVASAASAAGLIDVTAAPYNSADTFAAAPFVAANAVGNITGQVTAAKVTGVTTNYHVEITIDNRIFQASGVNEVALGAAGILNLTADDGSRIGLTLGASVAGLATAATFQTALHNVTGLSGVGAPATFSSTVTAANNNVDPAQVTVMGSVSPGSYIMWSLAGSNELQLSNGSQTWSASLSANGAQNVRFDNGVSIALGAAFDRAVSTTNIGFTVNPSATGSTTVTLQSGIRSTDTVTQSINGATTATLGISTLSVSDSPSAVTAGATLDLVIDQLSNYIASIGAFQGNLADTRASLESNIDTSKGAFSKLNDADILAELSNQNQAMVATQIAIAANSKAKELAEYFLQAIRG